MSSPVSLSLSVADTTAAARRLMAYDRQLAGPPESLTVAGDPDATSIEAALAQGRRLRARWDDGSHLSVYPDEGMVKASFTLKPTSAPEALALLDTIDFQLAVFAELYPEWNEQEYAGTGFGDGHYAHGWACAFRGAGHERLVSRRWLDHGPWLVHRGKNDTTLVQFHDLAADARTALAQAAPGHQRMGFSDTGGFLHHPHTYHHDHANEKR